MTLHHIFKLHLHNEKLLIGYYMNITKKNYIVLQIILHLQYNLTNKIIFYFPAYV